MNKYDEIIGALQSIRNTYNNSVTAHTCDQQIKLIKDFDEDIKNAICLIVDIQIEVKDKELDILEYKKARKYEES